MDKDQKSYVIPQDEYVKLRNEYYKLVTLIHKMNKLVLDVGDKTEMARFLNYYKSIFINEIIERYHIVSTREDIISLTESIVNISKKIEEYFEENTEFVVKNPKKSRHSEPNRKSRINRKSKKRLITHVLKKNCQKNKYK